ncbi:unnamed protein product [Acanthosepion pharaonis]|uniref:Uncharacterized protein n=1 Tax=Acanthosepion pharaonis TaxID=158019 RepID=A0A812DDL2_ACAPH|nr:unnamed protein product [Sepia pharaonis]
MFASCRARTESDVKPPGKREDPFAPHASKSGTMEMAVVRAARWAVVAEQCRHPRRPRPVAYGIKAAKLNAKSETPSFTRCPVCRSAAMHWLGPTRQNPRLKHPRRRRPFAWPEHGYAMPPARSDRYGKARTVKYRYRPRNDPDLGRPSAIMPTIRRSNAPAHPPSFQDGGKEPTEHIRQEFGQGIRVASAADMPGRPSNIGAQLVHLPAPASSPRAWAKRASPAGVGTTPDRLRTSKVVPTSPRYRAAPGAGGGQGQIHACRSGGDASSFYHLTK